MIMFSKKRYEILSKLSNWREVSKDLDKGLVSRDQIEDFLDLLVCEILNLELEMDYWESLARDLNSKLKALNKSSKNSDH